MYCPQCRTEYRRGFTTCADCEVDLIWELPPEPPPEAEPEPEYVEYVHVLSTYNQMDIAMLKSFLDGSNIKYYFQGENATRLTVQPTRLMVNKDEVESVRELIRDLKLKYVFFSE